MEPRDDERLLSDIGYNIRDKRESKGLSQISVAKDCGVSLAAYQRWENGATKFIKEWNYKKLKKILD